MYGETTDEKLLNFLEESAGLILSRLIYIDGTLSGISENYIIDIAYLDDTPYWYIAINSVTS